MKYVLRDLSEVPVIKMISEAGIKKRTMCGGQMFELWTFKKMSFIFLPTRLSDE